MFPQFGATSETLSKASTMVFRIGTDAHLYDDPEDVNIAPLLDSKFDSEKCEALKRLLALIAQGFDVSNFFPQVVKNVASQSFDVKKMVYLYLLHYAEKRPNEALLSINYFQKDLGDPNPLVRAWALRAMAGIRLHVISHLVLVAVGKCARDPSVYVRRCAAIALPKLNDLRQEENNSAIEEIVGILLSDHSPGVVGTAAAAFSTVCPNNLPLIGRNYKRLCEVLPDVEDWGQIVLIGILLRYVIARHGLVRESTMFASVCAGNQHDKLSSVDAKVVSDEGNFGGSDDICESYVANIVSSSFVEGCDEYIIRSGLKNKNSSGLVHACFISGESNEDIKILLQSTSPLLWSHNSAVVLAAVGVHWIMGPVRDIKRIVRPLLFLLRSSNASEYVILCNIQVFAKAMPSLFAPYHEEFFVCYSDSYQIRALKLEILSSIATKSSIPYIIQEFQEYIRDPDRKFASDTVSAIGLCAQRLPEVANACLEGLLALMKQETLNRNFESVSGEAQVLIRAIMSIKKIIKLDPSSHEKVIIRMVRRLDSIKVSAARAMIIWTIGQYNSSGPLVQGILTTVLRYLARCFILESAETKLQILNTSVKVLLDAKGDESVVFRRVLSYVIKLAKCDTKYDIRDRARMVEKVLASHLSYEYIEKEMISQPEDNNFLYALSKSIFGSHRNLPSSDSCNERFYLPGSLSQIVLHAAPGYEPLPKPCSLPRLEKPSQSAYGIKQQSQEETAFSDSNDGSDSDTLSQFSDEEITSECDSQNSITASSKSDESERRCNDSPLILLPDNRVLNPHIGPDSLKDMMLPNKALESWLDEQPSQRSEIQKSSARISVGDFSGRVKPKTHSLLNPENSNGLRVKFSFSSEISSLSPQLVCVELSFENCSAEAMSRIMLADEESETSVPSAIPASSVSSERSSSSSIRSAVPILVPMEEISSLEAGERAERVVQVGFHHHLLPLKLNLWCDGMEFPLKLRPDIGYFVRPFPIDVSDFEDKESRLGGIFECKSRCTFTDHMDEVDNGRGGIIKDVFLIICESVALKMLSNSNIALVSVDLPVAASLDDASGLRLRFSSQMLHPSIPCFVTITVEQGKCFEPLIMRVKMNCEETVFALNLLNRIVSFLVEA